ncbi:MAG: phytanoyl-CoA dioxygenase family protein [Gammaproteobacteria bacterium]|nr:phytanoyl-CoA dioxygenase family protein [Gammaproteobacteria bacterium]
MHLLDDKEMARFLRDGFVVLDPDGLGDDFHAGMYDAACRVHDEARAIGGDSNHLQVIGDNLRARIPDLDRLLLDPTVHGALASVLGEDYILHPHHFVHESSAYDQGFHQDGNLPWNDRAHYRTHRPNWAMLFYYPQRVTDDNGPTEVLPGTQYWTTNFERADGTWHRGDAVDKKVRQEALRNGDVAVRDAYIDGVVASLGIGGIVRQRIHVPRGGVVLAHYDLMHRGTRMAPTFDGRRFMYKFYYLRCRDPDRPSWRNQAEAPPHTPGHMCLNGVVERIWYWLRGDADRRPAVEFTDQVARVASAGAEDERIRLAYEIGWLARDDAGVAGELAKLLNAEDEALRRSMVYAAGIAGSAVEAGVLGTLDSTDARIRRVAASAAGEARLTSPVAIEALFRCLEDDADDLVRSNAAYALGNIARVPGANVSAKRLLARLDPAVEPDNTGNGGMSRSTVRVSVAYALCNMALDDDDLASLASAGLADHDRYVRGLAAAVLERHARVRAVPWLRTFVEHLARARFNDRPPRPLPG